MNFVQEISGRCRFSTGPAGILERQVGTLIALVSVMEVVARCGPAALEQTVRGGRSTSSLGLFDKGRLVVDLPSAG